MRFKNQRHDYTNARKIRDLIPDWFLDKQEIDTSKMKYKGRRQHVYKRCRAVFIDFLGLLMDDLIENNNRFTSPNRHKFQIYVCEKSQKETFIKLKRNGVYQDVDIIKSDAKIYHFRLFSYHIGPKFYRSIRIGYTRYKRMVKKVNEGMRYFQQ